MLHIVVLIHKIYIRTFYIHIHIIYIDFRFIYICRKKIVAEYVLIKDLMKILIELRYLSINMLVDLLNR